jgi:ethanolamine ammonia-lyase large subunit
LYLRSLLGLKRAPEFEQWLERMQLVDARGKLSYPAESHPLLHLARV